MSKMIGYWCMYSVILPLFTLFFFFFLFIPLFISRGCTCSQQSIVLLTAFSFSSMQFCCTELAVRCIHTIPRTALMSGSIRLQVANIFTLRQRLLNIERMHSAVVSLCSFHLQQSFFLFPVLSSLLLPRHTHQTPGHPCPSRCQPTSPFKPSTHS